jgi:hypothetical protein
MLQIGYGQGIIQVKIADRCQQSLVFEAFEPREPM